MEQLELPEKYKKIALVNPAGYFYLNHRMQCYFLGISVVIGLLQAILITVSVYQGFGYEYVLGSVVFLHCFFYFHHYKASRREALYVVNPGGDYLGFILFFQVIPLFIARVMISGDAVVENNQYVIAALLQPEMRNLFSIPNVFSVEDGHGLIYVYTTVLAIISTTLSLFMALPIMRVLCKGLSLHWEEINSDPKYRPDTSARVKFLLCGVVILFVFSASYFFNWFSSYGYMPAFSDTPLYSSSLIEAREFVEKGRANFHARMALWEFYVWAGHPMLVPLCVSGFGVWFKKIVFNIRSKS